MTPPGSHEDQRSGEPGRRGSDTAVPLREYLESRIAQHEANVGLELAHMKRDIASARAEFRDGISAIRSDFSALSTGLHASMLALQDSMVTLTNTQRDSTMSWRLVGKMLAFVSAFILTLAALAGMIFAIAHAAQ